MYRIRSVVIIISADNNDGLQTPMQSWVHYVMYVILIDVSSIFLLLT